jgi:superfamily II DNA or RNA helicase
MATFREFIKSIQSDGNDGQAFEHFCKWFLLNDPYWKTQVDKAWLWDEWPERWGPDCGIDLIFKHMNGETWAVQAKCYDEKYSVTKDDMNAFLTESNRAVIQHRLLLASTNGMSSNGGRACAGQEKPVTLYMLKDFEAAQVEYPSHISDLASAAPKTMPTPDPHQVRAIDDVVSKFVGHDRGQLIMACGTGKTFTTLWIKEALAAQTTLVLVPSLNLLSQTLNEWAFATKDSFDVLCVCSDKTVGKRDKEDMALGEAPFSVTSDLTDISDFLSGGGHKVLFCTYQSSDLIAEVQLDKSIQAFDLVIADEAHRCSGKSDAAFSKVLDGEAIRATKRLFTTATPRLYSSSVKKAAADRGVEVYGMDDEAVFGPVLHTLTFGQAIAEDLLNDYQVVIVGVDQPMIKEWIENQELVALNPDNQTDARTLAAKIGLLKAIKDYDLSRVISFHSRVNSAQDFASEVTKLVDLIEPQNRPQGSLWASHVSGTMRTTDRIIEIGKLKSLENADIGLLANARCLSEGVDVPSLDGIAFIDPRGSQVDIIQAVGRAIRKVRGAKTQSKGTIVLPVFIEDGDNAEAQIEASNFKPVWDVLKAFRSHDEVLAEHLDQYRTNMAKRSGTTRQTLDDRIIFDLPMTVDPNFSHALRTVLVEVTTTSWYFWYGLLQEYCNENNSGLVPKDHVSETGYKIGNWVSGQRVRKVNGQLPIVFVKLLESLPNWYWNKYDAYWDNGLSALKSFIQEHGHARVSDKYLTTNGFKLGHWIRNRRNDFKRGILSESDKDKLESFEGWVWNSFEAEWQRNFQLLKNYSESKGDCLVPTKFQTDDGTNLGSWVGTQRQNKNKLSNERLRQLEGLNGWMWNKLDADWETAYSVLKRYYFKNGEMPKQNYKTQNHFGLGSWLTKQRNVFRTLSEDKQKKLQIVNFEKMHRPDPEKNWMLKYSLLKKYSSENHTTTMHVDHKVDGINLGRWVVDQRQTKKNKVLSLNRTQLLEQIGFQWDIRRGDRIEGISKLAEYKKKFGDTLVPKGYETDGFHLGSWVQTMRYNRRKHTSVELEALNDLDFVWDINSYRWNQAYEKLERFFNIHGHCAVKDKEKVEDFRLGHWIYKQRKHKEKLTTDQIGRLNRLKFVWDLSKTKSASKDD